MNAFRRYPWRLFFSLVTGAVLSVLGLLPYLEVMLGPRLATHPLPLLVLVQSICSFSIATGLGLLAARALGVGAPVLEQWLYDGTTLERRPIVLVSIGVGAILGGVTLALVMTPVVAPLRNLAPIAEGALPLGNDC